MKIAPDKISHFLAGAAIAASVTLYADPVSGFIMCCLAAVGKELYDATGRGTPDKWDAIATILGSVVILPLFVV